MRKRVFSELLGRMVPINLTAHTLRCIDKAGGASRVCAGAARLGVVSDLFAVAGLDNYILNARAQELGTGIGPQLLQQLTEAKAKEAGNRLRAQAPT